MSISTYTMSYFKLSITLCNDLGRLMIIFWWRQRKEEIKIYWVGWKSMCKPNGEGGMGFKDLHTFNMALLAEQVQCIMTNFYLASPSLSGKVFSSYKFYEGMSRPCTIIHLASYTRSSSHTQGRYSMEDRQRQKYQCLE